MFLNILKGIFYWVVLIAVMYLLFPFFTLFGKYFEILMQ